MDEYVAPGIDTLSAHEYGKIIKSYNTYQQGQKIPEYSGAPRNNPYRMLQINADKARAARDPFKRGKEYGYEDEYRYMLSQGFKPEGGTVKAAAKETAEPEFEPYSIEDISGLIDDAVAKATPTELPSIPEGPKFIYNQPSLVNAAPTQFAPASIGIQRSNPFQRSGSRSSALKINKTLNV